MTPSCITATNPSARLKPLWQTCRRISSHHARFADQVVAGNEYLADLFRRHGGRATVLPTAVDPAHYQVKSHDGTQSPALVWIGSKSTLPYLRQFSASLAAAKNRVPGLRLITIADQPLSHPPLPAEHIDWSETTESASLCRGDIGIAPTPEDEWTLGKCGFKIVQYMAAVDYPLIASPVGHANAQIVLPGKTGFLPEEPGDWADAIASLAADPAKRKQMGAAARARVEEYYSVTRSVNFWATLLA